MSPYIIPRATIKPAAVTLLTCLDTTKNLNVQKEKRHRVKPLITLQKACWQAGTVSQSFQQRTNRRFHCCIVSCFKKTATNVE